MSSSGMGSAEVRSLSYKQLLESLQEYIKFPKNSMVSAHKLISLVEEKLKENELIVPMWALIDNL
jgi:hypothetical protein